MTIDRQQKLKFPITVTIFSVILLVSIVLSASIITYTHSNYRELALNSAKSTIRQSSENLELRVTALIDPVDAIARQSPDWPGIGLFPTPDGHPLRDLFLTELRNKPQISSIYIAYFDGTLYLVGKLSARPKKVLQKFGAPAGAVFMEQVIYPGKEYSKVIRHFLDKNDVKISTVTTQNNFDPRVRPWYKGAVGKTVTSRTDLYQFAGIQYPGLTISRAHNQGVVGVDITLHQLREFLDRQPIAKDGILAIFQSGGTILARSSPVHNAHTASQKQQSGKNGTTGGIVTEIARLLHENRELDLSSIDVKGQRWIVDIAKVPFGGNTRELLVVAVPMAVISTSVNRISRETLIVSVVILIACIPFMWLVSRGLSQPLISLANEANRIGQFDLDDGTSPNSMIEEVRVLQSAVAHMRSNLKSFAVYVPKALVRQLIERDEAPEIGGERRMITVLFTDLENFTAMSEKLGPEELMKRMSRYFEISTKILIQHDATIDKYIGDAVMAFWNAPNDTPDHVARACNAALAIVKATREETASWNDGGEVPLRTRIGIHCGEAIVGNVGSSDRMNYTALGATVNLAARLESLSRGQKTEILVSEDVEACIRDRFEVNDAGKTMLKGFASTKRVYELVGKNNPDN